MTAKVIAPLLEAIAAQDQDLTVTLAPQVVPVPDQALTQKSQRSRTHLLHKVIASRAKARITAQKQSLELNMSLAANGMRILTYTASGDRDVPGRSPTGSRRIARATAMVARSLKRKVHTIPGIQKVQIRNLMKLKIEGHLLVNP